MDNETELTPPVPGEMIDVGEARVALVASNDEGIDAFCCWRLTPTATGDQWRNVYTTPAWGHVVSWLRGNGDLA